jgi:hypothetical protein
VSGCSEERVVRARAVDVARQLRDKVGRARVTLRDGSTVACGAGSIQDVTDVETLTSTALEQLEKSPTACLAPE